ncbi:MAG: hypothetical protein K9M54_09175 [Kiritimatiellales bacterium]|nr:hypothetical protein [Kiritimatiellales bacterium]
MKTRVKSVIAVSAVLAGVLSASGQQQERRQQRPFPPPEGFGQQQQQQRCPACGAPRMGPQGQNQMRNFGPQGPQGQPFRQQGGPQFGPQQQQRRGQQQFQGTPQQGFGQQQFQGRRQQQIPPQMMERIQQKRQAILKRFDADGDGQLSEQERQAAKQEFQNRKNGAGENPPAPELRKQHKRQRPQEPTASE